MLIQQAGDAFSLRDIQLGCPLSGLAQEMSPIDEGFRIRLNNIYELWHQAIVKLVENGLESGEINSSVKPEQVAVMVVATMEGCLSMGMISQRKEQLMICGEGLIQYLNLIKK